MSIGRCGVVVGLTIVLAACAGVKGFVAAPQAVPHRAPPVKATAFPRKPPEVLLEFVTAAAPGQRRMIDEPRLGEVEVTIGQDYVSAANLLCRRFTVEPVNPGPQSRFESRAVCRENGAWRLDPVASIGTIPGER